MRELSNYGFGDGLVVGLFVRLVVGDLVGDRVGSGVATDGDGEIITLGVDNA